MHPLLKKHPESAPEQVRMFLFRGQVVLTLLFILLLFIRALSQPGETWREHSLNIVGYLGCVLLKEHCEFAMLITLLLFF